MSERPVRVWVGHDEDKVCSAESIGLLPRVSIVALAAAQPSNALITIKLVANAHNGSVWDGLFDSKFVTQNQSKHGNYMFFYLEVIGY